ncbi:Crp/Fnr family transcriptional regulator [Kineococcus indalonis]|uniref:Crp/Fnr family transcriptional regulator n=1 Tax=Kineococcus indalonis TaxID=2696566 RepID=UPI00141297D6|nr:Crp/Fnr family transcriptional regulator [Kineococcus indalonis]NAZ88280.1 helix-turn-helix domain-containing protein [Kineococcus indalonis]
MDDDTATTDRGPARNAVLKQLPQQELARVLARCEEVQLGLKHVVYDEGKAIEHVYFPLTAVFSHVALVDGQVAVEVGTIGPEGFVGLPAFLGTTRSPNAVFSQIEGASLRMSVEALHDVLRGDGALHRALSRYTQAMLLQLAQNVACNTQHTVEERAARWLLMTADRVGSLTFPMTQEFLAQMLGVRRPTVSLTAGVLQTAGLIRYARGVITVVDREGLLDASCDCYLLLREEFERLTQP